MSQVQLWLVIYGIFLIVGGVMGKKAGSQTSLMMGIVSGALIFLGAYLIGTDPILGYGLLTVLNGILTFVFVRRFMKTRKVMPAGMLFGVSFVAAVLCSVQLAHLLRA